MKDNTYLHTFANVIDYSFEGIKIEVSDLNKFKLLIKDFNNSTDKKYKISIAKRLPNGIFPICRICGNIIVNSKFKLNISKTNILKLVLPSVYCREIDGNKYYLSCCEDCLLEHFKLDPPKSEKYYFMKANKYGQYSFGYSNEEFKKICSMTVGVTELSMIKKYGEIEGKRRWEEYRKKQAITNTFEYKQKKYNWTKADFEEFNKNRAVTLDNLVKKYGDIEGHIIFEDYCKKQHITKSFEYMKEKYGEDKAKLINKSKALTIDNFINKYGEEEGIIKYQNAIQYNPAFYSKISQKLFNTLDKYLPQYNTYYATKNAEYGIMLSNKTYIKLDYYISDLKICIEFNGTVFHADPRIFKENDHPNPFNRNITAKEIWENDKNRIKELEKLGIKTIIVWELDYRDKSYNINDLIEKIKK